MRAAFVKRAQNYIFHKQLFAKGDKIVIGISGGPDSTCLAQVLNQLKKKHELELLLVHVNYGLRGKESEKDEEFAKDLAEKLNLEIKVKSCPTKTLKGNLEEQMRNFRYKVFEKVRTEKKYDWIAVGHTLDDQAETFLMNLMRGCGAKGLGAMFAKKGALIRPLLATEKTQITKYLKQIGQQYRIDKSNLDKSLTRNSIHQTLIPLIEKRFNPKFKQTIFRTCINMQRVNQVVDECAEKSYNEIVRETKQGLVFDASLFLNLSGGAQSLLFRKIVSKLTGKTEELSEVHFFEFLKLIKSPKSKIQRQEFRGIILKKNGNEVSLVVDKNKQ